MSRRSPGICFDVCGYSRKSRSICFDVCGYSRKSRGICFDICGYSRKSPGICFGVCGESRKCFGELVGRYNMLSMTFSMNKGISFFRRTHVCLPSAEALCWRPNYAAYPGHRAKPIECLFEAAQASAEAGEVCLVHDEVEFHLVPGQTLPAAVAAPIAAKRARPIFAPMIFDS